MPELPEVETMRRGILTTVGSRIDRAAWGARGYRPVVTRPAPATLARRIRGSAIEAVGRIGKRVVVWLDRGQALVFEPRMTGLLLIADPPDRTHLRLTLELSGGGASQLLFWDRRGLGTVQLLDRSEVLSQLGPPRIGPDALEIDALQLRDRLRTGRRAIKVALLDQQVLAGVGNLYASEILHVAGIHPQLRCHRLTRSQWLAIHAALREVLDEAIRCEGSTLGDGTYRTALNRAGNYQNRHRVYARAGLVCPTCSQAFIVRIVQSQRSTFFCPNCQRRR